MELLFLYVKKYDDIFENQQINFSSKYCIEYKDGYLNIEKKDNLVKDYYGDTVKTVTMLHGKNGSGKSTLLDLLGMKLIDRRRNLYRKTKNRSYFLMYHLYDNYFGFEFSDSSYIKGKIKNIDMRGVKTKSSLYKPWVGLVFYLKNKRLIYEGRSFKRWMEERKKKEKIKYVYITADKYNNRVNKNDISEEDNEYIFSRKYYLMESYYQYLYKYLIYMKNIDEFWDCNRSIVIRNIIEESIGANKKPEEIKIDKFLHEKKDDLENIFKNDKAFFIFGKKNNKYNFIKKFYIELIEYYFLSRFSGVLWVKEINSSGIEILTGEYEKLIRYIEKERKEKINKDEEYLCNILDYVLQKVDVYVWEVLQTNERRAALNILTAIKELPEKYFVSKTKIKIKCEEPIEEKVLDLLRMYDYINKVKNDEGNINTIDNVLQIIPPEMSEGQRVFLDIISKAVLAVNEAENGDHIVLLIDEPDRAIHPELARNFIDILLRNLNECQERTIQVVLTSHSPFIVTDILPENVYAITREESDGKSIIKQKQDTFATNIYYLLMDTFMLENTFGKYSYDKIKDAVKKLKDEEIDEKELNSIKSFIDRIGEKTVRKKLLELYYAKDRRYSEKQKISQEILHIDDEEKLRKIKRILDE